ncbi:MAG: hypothetical protein GY719_26190 [bacterium]|nr:hypothetical protein [bacterium]
MEQQCKTCGGWPPILGGEHVCPPKWRAWAEWLFDEADPDPEEGMVVYARDAESAAEAAFEKYEEDEPAGSEEEVFIVEPGAGGERSRWTVYREYSPTYRAARSEKPAKDCEP